MDFEGTLDAPGEFVTAPPEEPDMLYEDLVNVIMSYQDDVLMEYEGGT